jgi:uncharacterized protein YcaQ
MPILHGDELIGRIDPEMDRKREILKINAIYVEPGTPISKAIRSKIADSASDLGSFLGASEVVYGKSVPSGLRSQIN